MFLELTNIKRRTSKYQSLIEVLADVDGELVNGLAGLGFGWGHGYSIL